MSLEKAMEHKYFKDVDFDNLPTYEDALKGLTVEDKQLMQICTYLLDKYVDVQKL